MKPTKQIPEENWAEIERLIGSREEVKPLHPDWTQAYVREKFDYNRHVGTLIWKSGPRRGRQAGAPDKRYGFRIVNMDGHHTPTSKLIWLWQTGVWPEAVDHLNGDNSDDRWENLALIESKHRGAIRKADGRWQSRISLGGDHVWIGDFPDPVSAHRAYVLATGIVRLNPINGRFSHSPREAETEKRPGGATPSGRMA